MLFEFRRVIGSRQRTLYAQATEFVQRAWSACADWQTSPASKAYALLFLVAMALPLIYAFTLYPNVGFEDYERKHGVHVALNGAINVLCGLIALKTRGNLSHRLMTGIVGAFVAYALFLFVILGLRLYYSRAIMVVSILASIVIITMLSLLMDRLRTRRIGIVPQGLNSALMDEMGPNAVIIPSPDTPADAYDLVVINWSSALDPRWLRFASRALLSGCEVVHVAAHFENRQGRVLAEHFEADHASRPQNSSYILSYKRPLDLALVVLSAPVVFPILLVAAGLIWATMGGPILFTQPRVGSGGRTFKMYKLRSMRASEPGDAVTATAIGDPRVTPLGHYLRRYRIDELPQFYNVLIGDMSLVGPRPEQPELAKSYARSMPCFNYRTMLRPGITGWAQVRSIYAADELETAQKLAYDLYYVKHASFVMDMSILVQTVKTLLTGNSAR